MKIVCMKYKNDNSSFKFFQNIGMDTCELEDLEQTDKTIQDLVDKEYQTIVVTNEVAGFSGDIMTKYQKSDNIHIVIAPSKRK